MVAGRPAPARALVVRGRAAALRPARQERRVLRRPRLDPLGRDRVRARAPVRAARDPARAGVARSAGACAGPSTPSSSPASWRCSCCRRSAARALPAGCSWPPRSRSAPPRPSSTCARGAARLALTVLAPAPLLFLALFLFNSDVSRLSLSTETAQAAGERPRAPVVLIAFDELPVNSLLDAHGRIDAVRFPNFARLARGSTWFEHATTVGEGTTHAIPAILTGRFPKAGEFPVYTDHRQNLFTLFGGATQLHVVDQETHLCPPSLCPDLEGSLGHRTATLAEDTGVVYLHELLPDDLTGRDPVDRERLGQTSCRTRAGTTTPAASTRPSSARCARSRARASGTSTCCCPHSPWTYLPSGARYDVRPAPGWGSDEVWNVEPGRGRPVLAAAPAAARLRRPGARAAARPAPRDRPLRPRGARRHRRPRRQLPRRARSAGRCRRPTARTSPTCRCS